MARAYLYAVTDCSEHLRLGPIGVGLPPSDVEVVPIDGIGVALSYPADQRFAPTVVDIKAHQAVLDRLMQAYTVVPFSFATVADGWPAVERFVRRARTAFQQEFDRLRGRMEVGLKVFWRKEAVRAELERSGGLRPSRAAEGAPGGYNDAIRVGQAVEAVVLRWRDQYVPAILSALAPLSEDVREAQPVGATMLWNASFLVAREAEPSFRSAVYALDARHGERLDFRYSAALPPYSFTDLRFAHEAHD